MRLHHLRVTAFGPFADTVEVDFDALGEAGLFLINGPTGSGKTSLLDAVCFALYGDIPGARPKGALLSDHAAPGVAPEVELEWSAGSRRFRVRRSPEHQRPKKRGTGFVKEQHHVTMTELVDGSWEDRGSSRADEVAAVVQDVLGLGLAQFQTVMLLPQGDFARFLRDSTEKRAEVLQRLFATDRFEQVQRWLEERRRTLDAAVREDQAELRSLLARVDDAARQTLEVAGEMQTGRPPGDAGTGPKDSASTDLDGEEGRPDPQDATLATGPTGVDLDGTDPQLVGPALAALGTRVRDAAARLATTATEHERLHAEARERAEAARAVAQARHRGETASARLSELLARQEDVSRLRHRQTLATAAAEVLPLVQDAARRAELSAAAAEAHRRALVALGPGPRRALGVPADGPVGTVTDEGLAQARRALDLARELVDRLGDQAGRARTAHADAAGVREDVSGGEQALSAAGVAQEQAAARLDGLQEEARQLGEVAATEPQRRRRLDDLEDLTRRLRVLAADERTVQRARQAADDAAATRTREQSEVAALHARRAEGLAAELAARLTEGEACPVCGSTEHPRPAGGGADEAVTREQTEAGDARLDEARAAETTALAGLESARATRDSHAQEVASRLGALDDPAVEDVPGLLATARDDLAEAESARRQTAELSTRVTQAEAALDEARRAHARAGQSLAAARSRVEAAERRERTESAQVWRILAELAVMPVLDLPDLEVPDAVAEALEDAGGSDAHPGTVAGDTDAAQDGQLPFALPSDETRAGALVALPSADELARPRTALTGAEAAVRAVVDTLAEAGRTADQSEESTRMLTEGLHESPFDDAESVRAAALPRAEREALADQLAEYDRLLASTRGVLEEPEVTAALAGEAPDLAALEQAARSAETASRTSTRRAGIAQQGADQLHRLSDATTALVERLGPRLHEAEVVRQVADAVAGTGGDNQLRMSLQTYVLAARLEEVVALANERLRVMTDGRYELQHTDALAGRGARSGLGLLVVDGWNGKPRDTATLSGGETFMASLALALGLGDAVRAESGGIDLDTLFVDEGFGTLDEESLEQVMDVLDGLREGGRSVGIISHVSELRQRVHAQVRLHRTRTGSTLEVVTDDALV